MIIFITHSHLHDFPAKLSKHFNYNSSCISSLHTVQSFTLKQSKQDTKFKIQSAGENDLMSCIIPIFALHIFHKQFKTTLFILFYALLHICFSSSEIPDKQFKQSIGC